MIIALAGRRIDETDTDTPRFPLENIQLVSERLKTLFEEKRASAVVSSAACGSDLLALQIAGELGLRRRIILPSGPEEFRKSSVTDRPGNWGEIFDSVYADLLRSGDIVVMKSDKKTDEIYAEANKRILDEAAALASSTADRSNTDVPQGDPLEEALVVIVWEGAARGEDDITADFANKGAERGFEVVEILTK